MNGVVLFGPTSSGKTGLSLDVAGRLRAQGRRLVVLNADSRQVYRYMDIGTSKIARRDMQGVEHRLLDIVEPTGKTVESLQRLDLPAGVDIEIKIQQA